MQEGSPKQRAEQRAHAADDWNQQAFDRDRRAIGNVRIEIEEILSVEHAGQTSEKAGKHDRAHFHSESIDAECPRSILIVAHRHQLRAKAGVSDLPDG